MPEQLYPAVEPDGTAGGDGGARVGRGEPPPDQGQRPRPGLRERKRLETFYALQSAARRLIAERGLEHVTVEDIAAVANVSTRTFFNYFRSKHGAVVDPPPNYRSMMASALAAQSVSETALRSFRTAVVQAFLPQLPDQHQLLEMIRNNPELEPSYRAALASYEEIIIEWVAGRTGIDPHTSAYPRLFAAVVNAAVYLVVDWWEPDTGIDGALALHAEVFDLLEAGLVPPAP